VGSGDRKGSGLADVLERCRSNGGDVRFGAIKDNSSFEVELFARPEAIDAVTETAVVAGRQQVRYAANLLEIERLPESVWHVGYEGRTTEGLFRTLGMQLPPAFIADRRLFSFYDLREIVRQPSAQFPDTAVEEMKIKEFLRLPFGERGLVRLLNLSFADHLSGRGLIVDGDRQRGYFPRTAEGERQITYQGRIRKATRTVVKARTRRLGGDVLFWEHKALGYQFMRFKDAWAVVLAPGYAFTLDGEYKLLGRDRVNVLSTRRASKDYNATVHFDLNFWAAALAGGDSDSFELAVPERWSQLAPIIELSAYPPTISVLEPTSGLLGEDEQIFDELDIELEELAKEAEQLSDEPPHSNLDESDDD
jgi:hypothetical protein